MSAVCVLTPLVIASWPAISAAVAAAAASLGFASVAPRLHQERAGPRTVTTPVENSEVLQEGLAPGQKIVLQRGDLRVEVGQDQRGRCSVCVTGSAGHSDAELRKVGAQVAGRIVQQYTYNKLLTELKSRDYQLVDEQVLADQSIRIRVRR